MATAVWRHDADSEENTAEIVRYQSGQYHDGAPIYSKGFQHPNLSVGVSENDQDQPLRMILHHLIWNVETRKGGYAEIRNGEEVLFRHSGERHPETNRFSVNPNGR